MKKTPIVIDPQTIPQCFRSYIRDAAVYDSSCSPEARVIYIEKDGGYFLKTARKGALQREAEMTRFFHEKGLSASLLEYVSLECDWLMTARIRGEDATHKTYLDDPKRLCDLIATLLRRLHETPLEGCPIPNRTADYLAAVEQNYRQGVFDPSFLPHDMRFASADEAITLVRQIAPRFQSNVLLHGDYCLPNILLDAWQFSGFIDLGNGGVGDRHIDLFWGVWTLQFNLKTDVYAERFLDAYGRDRIDPELLRAVAATETFG